MVATFEQSEFLEGIEMKPKRKHGNKGEIIKRIRTLQKRTIPTVRFYEQFTVDDLKKIRDSAKIDYDLWKFEVDWMKKQADKK